VGPTKTGTKKKSGEKAWCWADMGQKKKKKGKARGKGRLVPLLKAPAKSQKIKNIS